MLAQDVDVESIVDGLLGGKSAALTTPDDLAFIMETVPEEYRLQAVQVLIDRGGDPAHVWVAYIDAMRGVPAPTIPVPITPETPQQRPGRPPWLLAALGTASLAVAVTALWWRSRRR